MLKRHGIKCYTSENEDLKAAVVQRFNITLKEKMFRYFTCKSTRRCLGIIIRIYYIIIRMQHIVQDDMLHSYNNTHHRPIGMAPHQVKRDNENVVRAKSFK